MTNDFEFDYSNDADKIGARMMANRQNNHIKEERERVNSYFLAFQMYCEKNVIKRLQRLQEKLAGKHMIFKFNGDKYAIFSMNQFKRTSTRIILFLWKMWRILRKKRKRYD